MTETLFYRLPWQSSAVYPGAHPGQMIGAGQLFKRHEPLIASPDPRRIDLRASVLDPFFGYRVRVYQQQSTVNVYVLADMSASMGYADKQQTLLQFLQTAANSAFGYGDKFGFIGCTERIEHRWLLPACQHLGRVSALAKQLERLTFTGTVNGLQNAAAFLPAERSLVFLLSDCHFPLPQLRAVLGSLQGHDSVMDSGRIRHLAQLGPHFFSGHGKPCDPHAVHASVFTAKNNCRLSATPTRPETHLQGLWL